MFNLLEWRSTTCGLLGHRWHFNHLKVFLDLRM